MIDHVLNAKDKEILRKYVNETKPLKADISPTQVLVRPFDFLNQNDKANCPTPQTKVPLPFEK